MSCCCSSNRGSRRQGAPRRRGGLFVAFLAVVLGTTLGLALFAPAQGAVVLAAIRFSPVEALVLLALALAAAAVLAPFFARRAPRALETRLVKNELFLTPAAPRFNDEEINGLLPFLEEGTLTQALPASDPAKRAVTSMAVVETPVDTVWETLCDVERYKEFLPKVIRSRIVERGEARVKYEITLDTPGAKASAVEEMFQRKDEGALVIKAAGSYSGQMGWRLYPVAEGRRTVVVHKSQMDVSATNPLLKLLLSTDPGFATAVNLSSVLVRVEAVKQRAEKRFKDAAPPRRREDDAATDQGE